MGRIEYAKGISQLISAFENIDDTDFELHIVGRGSAENIIKNIFDSRLIYHCFFNDKDLYALYDSCDVFVFPSYHENLLAVILEGLSSSFYVITSVFMKPRFDEFEKLSSLEYVNITEQAIRKAIIRVKDNLEHIRSIKRKREIYSTISEKYDWKKLVGQLCDHITKV
ncbi:glycosyltransferase [Oxyplasma meridianum]|uniref:Glycosyltransferase n=1 Tax=Oxyplasma meridianum TaxID=3073602 RepID=A0AAX4NGK5_9ARCH